MGTPSPSRMDSGPAATLGMNVQMRLPNRDK
jgi:hypothetical protein